MCRLNCLECDYGEDMSVRCLMHPIIYGMTKMMHQSMLDNRMWGNMVVQEDEMMLAKMSRQELEALEEKKAEEERVLNEGLKKYIIQKKRSRFCTSDGKLKQKFTTRCTDQEEKDGCWAHAVGACPYIHVGEEGVYNFGGKRMLILIQDTPYQKQNRGPLLSGDKRGARVY